MSVFVLEDLCFSFNSLPPNEAIVPVVSKAMARTVRRRDKERVDERALRLRMLAVRGG
jgi:hypothetical protein